MTENFYDSLSTEELMGRLKKIRATRAQQPTTQQISFSDPTIAQNYKLTTPELREITENSPVPLTITSAFRSPERNKAVGGVPNSYHIRGGAIDLRKSGNDAAAMDYFKSKGYKVLDEGDHLHIQPGSGIKQIAQQSNRDSQKNVNLYDSLSTEELMGKLNKIRQNKSTQTIAQEYSPKTGMEAVESMQPGDTDAFKKTALGLISGPIIPKYLYGVSEAIDPGRIANAIYAGKNADIKKTFSDKIASYEKRADKWKKDAPIASILGSIPENVVLSELGGGLAGKIPGLAKGGAGKALELLKAATRSGIAGTGIGQIDALDRGEGIDLNRIPVDFGIGVGGELIPEGLKKLGSLAQNGAARLINSALKVSKRDIKSGKNLGKELLQDTIIPRTTKGYANLADRELIKHENELQKILKSADDVQEFMPKWKASAYVAEPEEATLDDLIDMAFGERSPRIDPKTGFQERVIIRKPKSDFNLPARFQKSPIITRTSESPLGRSIPERNLKGPGREVNIEGKPFFISQEDLKQGVSAKFVNREDILREMNNIKREYHGVAGAQEVKNKIDNAIEALKLELPEKLSLSQANRLKRKLYSKLTDQAYAKAFQNEPIPITKDLMMAQASGLKKAIEEAAPEVKPINKKLSLYGRLKNKVDDLEASKEGKNLIPLLPLLATLGAGGAGYATGGAEGGAKGAAAALLAGTTLGKSTSAQLLKLLGKGLEISAKSKGITPTIIRQYKNLGKNRDSKGRFIEE